MSQSMRSGGSRGLLQTTVFLIVLNVLVYGLMLLQAGPQQIGGFSTEILLKFGALYAPYVRQGDVWRPFTAMFIHLDILHIVMNMIALYQAGPLIDALLGRARYATLYVLSGLGCSALSLAVHWQTPVVAAGASGAISGLIVAGAVIGHLAGTPAGRALRNSMGLWALLVLGYGQMIGADNAGHLGGMITGGILAWGFVWVARAQAGSYAATQPAAPAVPVPDDHEFMPPRAMPTNLLASDYLQQGVAHVTAHEYARAVPLLQQAVGMEPASPIPHYWLAVALFETQQYEAAAKFAARATTLDRSYTAAFDLWAAALQAQGLPAEAAAVRDQYLPPTYRPR
jgi:membrane associated rhomboid family serine protease